MKKTLIFLLAGFITLPVFASATSLPEDTHLQNDSLSAAVIVSTDVQSADDVGVITDEKKDVLAEDTKTDEIISSESEILPPNESDNIIKKKRDEFRMKQKNERENMRLELKKDKKVTASTMAAPVQKSTFEKIKGFFKTLF